MLADRGYQDQLPKGHPILVLHAKYLELGHEKDAQASKNYIANMSRVLAFVANWLQKRHSSHRHWSELLSCSEQPYVMYFEEYVLATRRLLT